MASAGGLGGFNGGGAGGTGQFPRGGGGGASDIRRGGMHCQIAWLSQGAVAAAPSWRRRRRRGHNGWRWPTPHRPLRDRRWRWHAVGRWIGGNGLLEPCQQWSARGSAAAPAAEAARREWGQPAAEEVAATSEAAEAAEALNAFSLRDWWRWIVVRGSRVRHAHARCPRWQRRGPHHLVGFWHDGARRHVSVPVALCAYSLGRSPGQDCSTSRVGSGWCERTRISLPMTHAAAAKKSSVASLANSPLQDSRQTADAGRRRDRVRTHSAEEERLLTRERNRVHGRHRTPLGAGGVE